MSIENEDRNSMNNMMALTAMGSNDMMCNNNNNSCDCCECQNDEREEMIKKIKCLQFAIIELALYLDTHPDDEKALCLHNKYCKEFKELKDKYQKVYGPLTINYPCNKWRWLEEPWPWEGGMN